LLTPVERELLLAFPATDDERIRYYTFNETDLSIIRQRRGSQNRLGFAVQLCYLRYPGFALPTGIEPPTELLALVARQLRVDPEVWPQYAQREETRREHLAELQAWLNLTRLTSLSVRFFPFREVTPQRGSRRWQGFWGTVMRPPRYATM
jgi:TnpA family transposase